MVWGTFWPIGNFKGCKVKETLALDGLKAHGWITFELAEIKMSHFGIQFILTNAFLTRKEKKFGPKNWSKFGQTWSNFGSKKFHPKKSNKAALMHEKSCQWIFVIIFDWLAKSQFGRFCQSQNSFRIKSQYWLLKPLRKITLAYLLLDRIFCVLRYS